MAAIPSYPLTVHIFSPLQEGKTPQALGPEGKKTASAIGFVLIRTYERKAETNHFNKKVLATESRLAAFGPLQTDRWFAPVVINRKMEAQRLSFDQDGAVLIMPMVSLWCGCGGDVFEIGDAYREETWHMAIIIDAADDVD